MPSVGEDTGMWDSPGAAPVQTGAAAWKPAWNILSN